MLFNLAADLEIHFLLTDEGLKAPFVLPHDPNWKGLSAEEINERLGKWKPSSHSYGGRRGNTGAGRESEHIKGQGGGGTDFRPVFRHVDEHPELEPNLLIYFTDGYGTCPDRAPAYPVMWLLTKDGQEQPWGWNVKFRNDG